MTEQRGQSRGPRTGVHPGTFDPVHNGHLDIIRRATRFDVTEREVVAAVAHLVGAAEPNEPEPNGLGPNGLSGDDPNEPEPNRFGSGERGGDDPNEPETSHRSGLEPLGPASGEPDHG
jgi:hypothetical protein